MLNDPPRCEKRGETRREAALRKQSGKTRRRFVGRESQNTVSSMPSTRRKKERDSSFYKQKCNLAASPQLKEKGERGGGAR